MFLRQVILLESDFTHVWSVLTLPWFDMRDLKVKRHFLRKNIFRSNVINVMMMRTSCQKVDRDWFSKNGVMEKFSPCILFVISDRYTIIFPDFNAQKLDVRQTSKRFTKSNAYVVDFSNKNVNILPPVSSEQIYRTGPRSSPDSYVRSGGE